VVAAEPDTICPAIAFAIEVETEIGATTYNDHELP
jgi:hypothetical protein